MRFFLHATKKTKSLARSSIKKTARASLQHQGGENSNTENTFISAHRQWGQQCSPNCGCVVRFESTVDETNTIVSATYHAKQLMISRQHGHIQPHYLMTTNRHAAAKPLLTECTCMTLHSLSQRVVQYIQDKRIDQIQNCLSSGATPAIVHASLKTQELPTSHSHCFHLVQQAVVAMTCGYLPSPKSQPTFSEYLYQHYGPHVYNNDKEEEGYGVDENSGISIGTRAVDIFDMHQQQEEELEEQEEGERIIVKKWTWETYVDELYHHHDDENGGVQWSA